MMNGSWQGLAAIIAFFLLVLLFLATVTGTSVAGGPALSGNQTTTRLEVPLINRSFSTATVEEPTAIPPVVIPVNGQGGGTTYLIQPGDWLSSIARRYNTTVPAILAINPQLTNPNQITPGQAILIPSTTQ